MGLFDEPKKRTLTPTQKTKLKDKAKGKCQICGNKEDYSVLCVHHIREVAKAKYDESSLWVDYSKPQYDRKSNLLVLCPTCHRKIHAGLITKKKQKVAKSAGKSTVRKRIRHEDMWGNVTYTYRTVKKKPAKTTKPKTVRKRIKHEDMWGNVTYTYRTIKAPSAKKTTKKRKKRRKKKDNYWGF